MQVIWGRCDHQNLEFFSNTYLFDFDHNNFTDKAKKRFKGKMITN